jgi:hypothetical protein
MFQFFRGAFHRPNDRRPDRRSFRARSATRDGETDKGRIVPIMRAIEAALVAAERERSGLSRRVCDVLERAAVTIGNGDDEYLHREQLDRHHQNLFDQEILNGQRRLDQLSSTIAHLQVLKAAALTRFEEVLSHSDTGGVSSAP